MPAARGEGGWGLAGGLGACLRGGLPGAGVGVVVVDGVPALVDDQELRPGPPHRRRQAAASDPLSRHTACPRSVRPHRRRIALATPRVRVKAVLAHVPCTNTITPRPWHCAQARWGHPVAAGSYGVSPFHLRSLHTVYPAVDSIQLPDGTDTDQKAEMKEIGRVRRKRKSLELARGLCRQMSI